MRRERPAFENKLGRTSFSEGTIWLFYQPINTQTLTWNEVYASSYFDNAWSAPVLVGFNYNYYNVASGGRDPGLIVFRADRPQVAFWNPDQKIRRSSPCWQG